ncbi:mannose-6-phosphate isomerase [Kaistia soli DSM 19436]|uniref:Mannose-6-phosphate isomerase n=1 Tax=Kaistia soli DSM 19436 TaxID=1122133 RepID=A0A1M5PCH0_9HYPH|nr:class I mannose-6-phosphate isomerase [Kaistia soli]SHG99418.1 mannose-6-phosphate isomerase [Kaistia soli DSM 19436]
MIIEHASTDLVPKPWGTHDLRPWAETGDEVGRVGEIWFRRRDPASPEPALLLKVLFTTERLSVQVHPDDDYARRIGLPNGKTEAWYVLASEPGGEVALGLKQSLTAAELRLAIVDGSLAEMIAWRDVHSGDAISVPAGTIHAIGAGLVVAEIQQRSDATFRMFDYGRGRTLQIDDALAVADGGPAAEAPAAYPLDEIRTVLVVSPYFVFELIQLPPETYWNIEAGLETWILVLDGHGRVGSLHAFAGRAFFLEGGEAPIESGHVGVRALVAYGSAVPRVDLLSISAARTRPVHRWRRRGPGWPRHRHHLTFGNRAVPI